METDLLANLLPAARQFRLVDVDLAPDVPGVYVWYGSLVMGLADLKHTDSLVGVLDTHSARFERQRMSLKATLNFNLAWAGEVDAQPFDRDRAKLLKPELTSDARRLVCELLQSAQHEHRFFQPLYIGKAARQSLRARLRQHAEEFLRLKQLESSVNGLEHTGEDDFAQRAVKLGFSEDQLSCYTIGIDCGRTLPDDQLYMAISIVESYLNDWAAPLLGRR